MGSDDSFWAMHGRCKRFGPELFFAPADADEVALAKAICRICPVSHLCLQWALDHRIEDGVWGGYTEVERRSALRHGRVLRPVTMNPKHTAAVADRFFSELIALSRITGSVPSKYKARVYFTTVGLAGWESLSRYILGNWTLVKRILILMMFRAAIDESPAPVKLHQLKQLRVPGYGTKLFGSPGRALELAGAPGKHAARRRSRQELLKDYARVCNEYRKVLGREEFARVGKFSRCAGISAYRAHFVPYKLLIEEAQPHLLPELRKGPK